jgi:hypothetical protein
MMDHMNPCCYEILKPINVHVTINGYYLLCGPEYATNTTGMLIEFHSKEEKQEKKAKWHWCKFLLKQMGFPCQPPFHHQNLSLQLMHHLRFSTWIDPKCTS